MRVSKKKVIEDTNRLLNIGIMLCLIGILSCQPGCAVRMSVTPIQAEEFTQKTVTNQFLDWLFNKGDDKK